MSVYNGGRYVREAVESILNQTFNAFEFIIIDDCSTDTTWQILTAYAARDSRIMLIRNEKNIGLTRSMNKGLALERWVELLLRARQRALARFHPDHIFSRYLAAMEAAMQRPTTVALRRRLWLAWSEPVCWQSRELAKALEQRLGPTLATVGLNCPRQGR